MCCFGPKFSAFYIVKSLDQTTLRGCHFKMKSDIDLRFFAIDHKYPQDIIAIKFEKVKNPIFKGGGTPLKGKNTFTVSMNYCETELM